MAKRRRSALRGVLDVIVRDTDLVSVVSLVSVVVDLVSVVVDLVSIAADLVSIVVELVSIVVDVVGVLALVIEVVALIVIRLGRLDLVHLIHLVGVRCVVVDLGRVDIGEHAGGVVDLDPAAAWASVAARLTPREVPLPWTRRLRRPVVMAIVTAVLAVPTVAYAAAPDVLRNAARTLADLLPGVGDGRSSDGRPPSDRRDADVPTTAPDSETVPGDEHDPAADQAPTTTAALHADDDTPTEEPGGDDSSGSPAGDDLDAETDPDGSGEPSASDSTTTTTDSDDAESAGEGD